MRRKSIKLLLVLAALASLPFMQGCTGEDEDNPLLSTAWLPGFNPTGAAAAGGQGGATTPAVLPAIQ